MTYDKRIKNFVIVGGITALLLLVMLDVFFMIRIQQALSIEATLMVMREANTIGLIMKLWLVTVGIVGLYGWSNES